MKKKKEKFVRKERYTGECSRSFYVGENVKEEDIKAKFRNGTLMLEVPKRNNTNNYQKKKYITIE